MPSNGGGSTIARMLDGLIQSGSLAGLGDQELLTRFVDERDPRALEAIINRHGALVLSVCRLVLADPNDVEDAFQASFLILIRKAGSVRQPGSLASWLYGVAYRTALRLKRTATPIALVSDRSEGSGPCPLVADELMSLLHLEINRLPEKYRQPIVLCYLEGLTHDDAAARLQWPVGTVRGRLARARDRLRGRLERRGVSLSAGLPAVLDRLGSGSVGLPENLFRFTSLLLERGVSMRVSSLVQGVIFTMLFNKLKWTVLALAASSLMVVAAGTGLRAIAGQGAKKGGIPNFQQKADPFRPHDVPKAGTNNAAEAAKILAVEERAESLEQHKVDAELLEIKTQSLKAAIQNNLQAIQQYESGDYPTGGLMSGQINDPELSARGWKSARSRSIASNGGPRR